MNRNRLIFTLLATLAILHFLIIAQYAEAEVGFAKKIEKFSPDTLKAVINTDFLIDTLPGMVNRESEIRAGLLFDAESGKIVWQKDMYYAYPIASLTKMMVALLAVNDIKAGKVDWADEVKVERKYVISRRNRHVYSSTETYTLESLVQLAMIPSNNQACMDIAKYLGGSVEAFVTRMNEKAASLGMKNTFYSNPSGLPGAVKEIDNSASPHDLLLLALELIKYKEILKITSIGFAEVSNDKRTEIYRNHNHLVINYENDVDGLKTGYTKRAKFCLVATAKKEGHRLISIVLGVDGPYLRNEIVASMLNNYYEKIGCGIMQGTNDGPIAKNSIVSDPVDVAIQDNGDGKVTYKTVWTKQKKTHVVKKGETLSSIAQKYNSSFKEIKKWNRISSNRIVKGQKLMVYVNIPKKVAVKNVEILENEDETIIEPGNDTIHTILEESLLLQKKDTNSFQQKEKILTKTALKKNEVKKPAINSGNTVKENEAIKKYVYHTVQPGDTLWSIAQRYEGISVDEIKRVNNIQNSKNLKPGTKLKIKIKVTS